MSNWVNINTQATTIPNPFTDARDGKTYWNPESLTDILMANGWRYHDPAPDPVDGYERLFPVLWAQDQERAEWAVPVINDTLIADRLAAEQEAAQRVADQARLPVPMPTGIEVPVLVLVDTDTNIAHAFYNDNGDLVGGVLQHASPTPDAATLAARKQAAVASRRAERQTIKDQKQRLKALTASAFTGQQKVTVKALLDEVETLRQIVAALIKGEV